MSPNDIIVHCKTSQQVAAASLHPFAGFFWGVIGWLTGTVASGLWSHKTIEAERKEIAANWMREQSEMRAARNRYDKAFAELEAGKATT